MNNIDEQEALNNYVMKGTEKKYSKYYLLIKKEDEDEPDQRWQEVVRINPPCEWNRIKQYAKDMIDRFNASRKEYEKKRILLKTLKTPKKDVKLY